LGESWGKSFRWGKVKRKKKRDPSGRARRGKGAKSLTRRREKVLYKVGVRGRQKRKSREFFRIGETKKKRGRRSLHQPMVIAGKTEKKKSGSTILRCGRGVKQSPQERRRSWGGCTPYRGGKRPVRREVAGENIGRGLYRRCRRKSSTAL